MLNAKLRKIICDCAVVYSEDTDKIKTSSISHKMLEHVPRTYLRCSGTNLSFLASLNIFSMYIFCIYVVFFLVLFLVLFRKAMQIGMKCQQCVKM